MIAEKVSRDSWIKIIPRRPSNEYMAFQAPWLKQQLVMKEEVTAEEFDVLFPEVLKYIWLSRYYPIWMYSEKVDSIWHAMILNTRQYAEFCQKFFSQFIHHEPASPFFEGVLTTKFEYFVDVYEDHFGTLPDIWNVDPQMCGKCGKRVCR